ncbi:MAG: hypothetical protein HY517_01255 [Candidatus Aenigmarchaeota archaeon]|nr:hypothetical protein [Candidatus Aenigmarchaeota archaeon]
MNGIVPVFQKQRSDGAMVYHLPLKHGFYLAVSKSARHGYLYVDGPVGVQQAGFVSGDVIYLRTDAYGRAIDELFETIMNDPVPDMSSAERELSEIFLRMLNECEVVPFNA